MDVAMPTFGIMIHWRRGNIQDWWREPDGKVKTWEDKALARSIADKLPAFTATPATCKVMEYQPEKLSDP
jgi:hypothetical protein